MEKVKQIKAKQEEMWNNTNRFQSQIRKEQEMLACEIQEVRKDLMEMNAKKGRPMFFGCLKSDYGASSSSQTDQQEPMLLQTASPLPGYRLPRPPPN
ncbi:hypothetical protein PIB30_093718 [Stylosanthes scabra]|uniref:Uncharacterized protein n=1 Tax=Stylosanthes scabra TaxID=79078 RepID=A0ABU6VVK6_9FABA|nr:hypothetical protein [Stylosanthes scabra]